MRRFWPPAEAAQVDYEQLRAAVLEGCPLAGPAAARFESEGLWGLIRKPAAPERFTARLWGAIRPPWTPYGDPRVDLLADAYQLVLCPTATTTEETGT
jgi:hypothetical protein